MLRKSGRAALEKRVSAFEDSIPADIEVLVGFVERHGLKTADIFVTKAPQSELDAIKNKIDKAGRGCVLPAKETSVLACANLLDVLVNALPHAIVPVEFFSTVSLALVQTAERDRLKCLRRIFVCLPPANKAMLNRLALLVSQLRGKTRSNKLDQERLDAVFAFPICHAHDEHTVGDVSSLFLDTLCRNYSALFGGKGDINLEKDDELPVTFISALRISCNSYANSLLPDTVPVLQKAGLRSSRKSVQGWDDVFAIMKPTKASARIGNLEAEARDRFSPYAKELGKLLFYGKMGAAKKLCEMRNEAAAADAAAQNAATVVLRGGDEYTGPKDAAGRPHGQGGRLVYRNGDVYEGTFVSGEPCCNGILVTSDGSKYVGTFRNGMTHGSGTFTYANGDIYQGAFENDAFHGRGRYVSHTGTVYEGTFDKGMRHGQGKFQTSLGHTFIGDYVQDQMQGLGIYIFSNGDEYQGEFLAGKFHGKGAFKTKDRLVEGLFREGVYAGPDPDAQVVDESQ